MSDFTVNVTNNFESSVSISPLDAWGFGCNVPPGGKMNFSFRSEGRANSITLGLILLSGGTIKTPRITDIRTIGGTLNVNCGNIKPWLVTITNSDSRSTTDVIISGEEPCRE